MATPTQQQLRSATYNRTAQVQQQAQQQAVQQYNQTVASQQQTVNSEIAERQARIDYLQNYISKLREHGQSNTTSYHNKETEMKRLQGEVTYLSEAQKIVQGGTAVNVSNFDTSASEYAVSTPEYQRSLYKARKKEASQQKYTKPTIGTWTGVVEESMNDKFEKATYYEKGKSVGTSLEKPIITTTPAQPEIYFTEREVYHNEPVQVEPTNLMKAYQYSKLSPSQKFEAFGTEVKRLQSKPKEILFDNKVVDIAKRVLMVNSIIAPNTEIVKVTKTDSGEIVEKATEEEKKFYLERKSYSPPVPVEPTNLMKAYQYSRLSPSQKFGAFGTEVKRLQGEVKNIGIVKAYNQGQGIISGSTNVVGYIAGSMERKLGGPFIEQRVIITTMAGKIAPYLIPGFGQALYFAEGIEEKWLSSKAIKGREEIAKRYELYGFKSGKGLAEIPINIKLVTGFIAVQAYASKNPIVIKGKQVRTMSLVPDSSRTATKVIGNAESRFKIVQTTTRTVTTYRQGLIVFPQVISPRTAKTVTSGLTTLNLFGKKVNIVNPTYTQTFTRTDKLMSIGNIAYRNGEAYGFVMGQRQGAKIAKIYALTGKVSPANIEQIGTLPKIQSNLLTKTGVLNTNAKYGLANVQLKELGRLKKVGGEYFFTFKEQTGKTLFGSLVAGKTEPVRTISKYSYTKEGFLKKDIIVKYKGQPVVYTTYTKTGGRTAVTFTFPEEQNVLSFSNIAGKRTVEGLPRAGGKIFKMDILTSNQQVKKLTALSSRILGGSGQPRTIITDFLPNPNAQETIRSVFGQSTKFYSQGQSLLPRIIPTNPLLIPSPSTISGLELVNIGKGQSALISAGTRIAIPPAQIRVLTPKGNVLNAWATLSLLKTFPRVKPIEITKPASTTKIIDIVKPIEIVTPVVHHDQVQPEVLIIDEIVKPILKPTTQLKPKANTNLFAEPPKPTESSFAKTKKAELAEAFGVFIRRFGKDTSIGTFKTKEEAKGKLFSRLRATLAASGYITQGKEKISVGKLGGLDLGFGTSKREKYRVVELKNKRLKLGSGETKEIKMFKKKGRRKSVFGL
jgi:hypothetical protein